MIGEHVDDLLYSPALPSPSLRHAKQTSHFNSRISLTMSDGEGECNIHATNARPSDDLCDSLDHALEQLLPEEQAVTYMDGGTVWPS